MDDLKTRISNDMKQAMRDGDKQSLEAIRLLRAEIQRREVDERIELTDEQVQEVIQKMVKKANDSIEQFSAGGREDLAEHERQQLKVISVYLPAQLSEEEVQAIIDDAITKTNATSMKDMGAVMAIVKEKTAGRADMGAVSKQVKAALS